MLTQIRGPRIASVIADRGVGGWAECAVRQDIGGLGVRCVVIHATIIARPDDRNRPLIPLRDANPGISSPLVTLGIIGICVYVLFGVQFNDPQPERVLYELATIPCEVITAEPLERIEIEQGICQRAASAPAVFEDKSVLFSLLASLFMHGSIIHLVANMWSLWIFGNNVEDAFGKGGYVVFYVLGGLAATAVHIVFNPSSTIPVVGASGAIAAVMGAYLVLFPTSRIVSFIPPFFFIPFAVRAWIFLGIWFLGQFAFVGQLTNVAWEAHVGGFVFGLVAATALRTQLRARIDRGLQRVRRQALGFR